MMTYREKAVALTRDGHYLGYTGIEEFLDAASDDPDDTTILAWMAPLCARVLYSSDRVWSVLSDRARLGDAHLEALVSRKPLAVPYNPADVFRCIADHDERVEAARQLLHQGLHLGEPFAARLLCQPILKWSLAPLLDDALEAGLYVNPAYALLHRPPVAEIDVTELTSAAAALIPPDGGSAEHLRVCLTLIPTWELTTAELSQTATGILACA